MFRSNKASLRQVLIHVGGSIADPAHIVRLSIKDWQNDSWIHLSGTRWERVLIWLLVRTVHKRWRRGYKLSDF